MSIETAVASLKAQLTEPERSRLRTEAMAAEPRAWMRRSCPLGAKGHVIVRGLPDFDHDTPNRVTDTGYVCLDCRIGFGGGLGLMDFRNVLPINGGEEAMTTEEPRITVQVEMKVNLGNYESAGASVILTGLQPGVTTEEINELLDTGKLAWSLMTVRLGEKVAELKNSSRPLTPQARE